MDTKKKPSINELIGVSMEKVKEMADVNSIIGDPITTADGTTVIPISKVCYGFASGGSDLPSKYDKDLFAGGAGAGISIKPEGFLVISPDGTTKMVTVESGNDKINSAINSVPTFIEKIQSIINKKKAGKKNPEESEVSLTD
ncbi:MAG: sporulation protein YtfJ [Ruminococcus sp.]|nr:sporulation protein YtfJ [Ruminococcus sp.]MDE7098379.1 sporulation protein YtfJ [Ruminococcus sp.]MDE7364574.1 sporulation protein YtfJ [Ruminococcus sp.]